MINENNPIGVFDSGIGGLSVLREIHALLPGEALMYVADSLHAPYGNKPAEFIQARALAITAFFIKKNVKAVVIACNTATYAAASLLRDQFPDLVIIGMEPGIKPAVNASQSKIIGALATENTLSSERFKQLVDAVAADNTVIIQPCYGLVEKIEQGDFKSKETMTLLERYLTPLIEQHIDTLVLGCTHYAFVRDSIQHIVGPKVTLIETGAAVAKQLKKRLIEKSILNIDSSTAARIAFWSSQTPEQAQPLIARLWGAPVNLQQLP